MMSGENVETEVERQVQNKLPDKGGGEVGQRGPLGRGERGLGVWGGESEKLRMG